MEIQTVGVFGCGLMGSGIAQVAGAAGYRTVVREVNAALQAGMGRIQKFLTEGVTKGKITEDAQRATLANLADTTQHRRSRPLRRVIEAIVEDAH